MRAPLKAAFPLFALSLVFPAFFAADARAEPPVPAEGVFAVEPLSEPPAVQPAGDGVCFIELETTFWLSGTLEGAFTAEFFIIQFAPCDQFGPQLFIADGTYDGSVDTDSDGEIDDADASGSFDFVFVGEIDEAGMAEGDLVIGRGTEELKNLSGRITLAGVAGVGGDYTGRIHFAP